MAAVAHGGVIGRDGTIPWKIPEDMRHFRALTMGHPVVMGRRTWESLPGRFRPLPGRRNVVVTRSAGRRFDGAERAGSLDDALRILEGADRVFVIGGGELYAAALPVADELLLTEIEATVEGDTLFPSIDRAQFDETSRERHVSVNGTAFAFVTYLRRPRRKRRLGRPAPAASERVSAEGATRPE
ncbi:MAG: dihydrofolate reductase [Gaiellaceae bacterium]